MKNDPQHDERANEALLRKPPRRCMWRWPEQNPAFCCAWRSGTGIVNGRVKLRLQAKSIVMVCKEVSRYLCIGSIVLVTACQGSWADQTVVHLAPVGHTWVKGLAIVAMGRTCNDEGQCRLEGSNVMTQLTAEKPSSLYRMILAEGNCGRPPKTGVLLAEGTGDVLNSNGTSTQIEIPVIRLTGGNYVIVVQNGSHLTVACGVIHRAGPV